MEWIAGIFIVGMLGLLAYSVISASLAIRKKAQPSVDSFFEVLYAATFFRTPMPKANQSENPDKK